MNLEPCSKCDDGVAIHHPDLNRYKCDTCGNSPANSYCNTISDAGRAWNECNTPTRTMAEVMAENEELRADILKTVIESGEVLKHHTAMVAHIERLHYSLCEMSSRMDPMDDEDSAAITRAKEATSQTPAQSLSIVEGGAIRKAAHSLCQQLTGKKLVSHTQLIKYAEKLEQSS